MLNAALQNPNLTETERAAVKAQAQRRGLAAALGLLGGLVASAAERARKQEERAEQRAARKEKQIEAEMQALSAPPQEWKAAAQAYLAQKALASFHAQEQSTASLPPKEESKPWWQRLKDWGQQHIVQPVKQTTAKAANWVNQHIVQPVKQTTTKAANWVNQHIVQPVQQAVPKVMNWIDQHQTQIALGIGIAAGVAAILSGGIATPLVAAAWVAGSAVVAGGVAALGTVGLNAYFQRPLGTNVWRNLGYAAGAAAVTATVGFALQAAAPAVTRTAAQFCLSHVTTCTVAAPAFKAADYAWTGYDVWQSQRTLANPNAEPKEKLLAAVNIGLAAWSESLEPDDALAIGLPLDDVVRKELMKQFAEILEREGKEAAFEYLRKVLGNVPLVRLGLLEDDVIEYITRQGPDALKALLSGWSDKELKRYGRELALRAEKDGKALKAADELVQLIQSGSIDSKQREALIEIIARNSMQEGEAGQVVIGAWKGLDDGYIGYARQLSAEYYQNHPGVWDALGKLGKEQQSQLAWEINQAALRPYIEQGVPFEYALKGIDPEKLNNEKAAIEAIWNGASDAEIMDKLKGEYVPTRIKELRELYQAGYEFIEDVGSYIFIKP